MECLTTAALVEYLCGLPAPESRTDVEAHLDECADCRRLADELARHPIDGDPTFPRPPDLPPPGEAAGDAELRPGAEVGRYVIRRRVGDGGMGVVYEARDPLLQRRLAVKVLRGDTWAATEEMRQRLLREAQALARLIHPHVVAIHDVGRVGDHLFIAMDFIDGSTVEEWLRAARRGWRDVLDVYLRAGSGLAAAHDVGLVHRDFKPHNVLIGKDGRVCVTDFGLVRLGPRTAAAMGAGSIPVDGITRDGVVMGSPGYMAPEQMAGGELDAACDVFSYSVSLYEALYGEKPFRGQNLLELCAAIVGGEVPEAPSGSLVPAWLRAIVLGGLAPSPAARPRMRAMLDELERDRASHGLALAEKLLEEASALARASGGDAEFVKVAARLLRDFIEQGPYDARKEEAPRRDLMPAPSAPSDPGGDDEIGPDAPILADVEIIGAHAQALLGKLGYRALASHFMLREGLGILLPDGTTGFDPDTWYPAWPFVRAAHNLVRDVGPRASSFHAGLFTRDRESRAPLPDMRAGLAAIDRTYHRAFRLRGQPLADERGDPLPGIGRYLCADAGEGEVIVTATGPWPCELDRGMVMGIALRLQPEAVVEHDGAEACRRRGQRRCVYRVRWGASALAAPTQRLRRAGGVDDFLRDPAGRYVAGRTFLYWYADPHLDGAMFWGRPTVDELQRLIAVWDALANDSVTHATLIDVRRVVEITPEAFALVQALLRGRREEYGRRIRAMALLRPPAMPGALITGLLQMQDVLHPFEFFDDEAAALAWMGRPDAALAASLVALRDVTE